VCARNWSWIVFAAALAFPAAAAAQGEVTVSLTPAVAGKPSRLALEASGQAVSSGQQPPKSFALFIARGFRFDSRSRAARCTAKEESASNCPAASRVATGTAEGEATAPLFGTFPFRANIEAFLAPRSQRGDIAGVVLEIRGARTASAHGRLLPVNNGSPFGSELLFENLTFPQPPAGASAKLNKLTLLVSAGRKVRKVKVRKRRVRTRHGTKIRRKRIVRVRRFHLITNPATCAGSWPYQLRVGFQSAPEFVRDGSVACSSR
jgi:hypothetical protein